MKRKFGGALLIGAIATVIMFLFGYLNGPLFSGILWNVDSPSLDQVLIFLIEIAEFFVALAFGTLVCKIFTKAKFKFWAILVATVSTYIGIIVLNYLLAYVKFPAPYYFYLRNFVVFSLAALIITCTAKAKTSADSVAADSVQEDREKTALYRTHRKAKSKLVWGIVLMALAFVVEIAGLMAMMADYMTGLLMVAATGVMWAIGIPCFITGLIGTIKSNRRISQYEQEQKNAAAQAAPAASVAVAAPVEQAAAEENAAEEPASQELAAEPATEEPAAEEATASATGFVDIDWQKYAPLDAGVSYKKDKDYKFQRYDGFAGSVPQKFVDRTFIKCPICCSAKPNWTLSQHNQMSWKGNLYLFKCSCCEGIISMSMPDVTTLGNGGSGVALNPTVGLTNLMVKAGSGKEAGAVYAVIESVGTSSVNPVCEGKEFKLEHVQEMMLRM
ncbi:MAG: hypothetical protein IKY29_01640 [Clostridia bacterium]|nr:hypothetical protein [Clostridia bacterium]